MPAPQRHTANHHLDDGFNSLLEMQLREACPELRPSPRRFQFSIGDALMQSSFPRMLTHALVSILYWRCREQLIAGGLLGGIVFQFSIGDARLRRLPEAALILPGFNSLLEMRHLSYGR